MGTVVEGVEVDQPAGASTSPGADTAALQGDAASVATCRATYVHAVAIRCCLARMYPQSEMQDTTDPELPVHIEDVHHGPQNGSAASAGACSTYCGTACTCCDTALMFWCQAILWFVCDMLALHISSLIGMQSLWHCVTHANSTLRSVLPMLEPVGTGTNYTAQSNSLHSSLQACTVCSPCLPAA
jgi:hypothetical protein